MTSNDSTAMESSPRCMITVRMTTHQRDRIRDAANIAGVSMQVFVQRSIESSVCNVLRDRLDAASADDRGVDNPTREDGPCHSQP